MTRKQKVANFESAAYASLRQLPNVLFFVIAFGLILKARLVFSRNINWDEFHYLSFVYDYVNQELTSQFQTLHVYFFTWLSVVSVNEASQIIAARLAMYLISLASCFLIYLIGRRFLERPGALFAVLCYLSYSYVVVHDTSFRPDPIVAFFSLAAIYMATRQYSALDLLFAGSAIGIAMMFSIKAVLFLPVVALLILITRTDPGVRSQPGVDLLYFCAAAISSFVLIYFLHASSVFSPDEDSVSYLERAAGKVVQMSPLFPARHYLLISLKADIVFWLALLTGFVASLHSILSRPRYVSVRVHTCLVVLLLPLTTLLFYRNAFPYFYLLVIPTASVVCGSVFERLLPNAGAAADSGRPLIAWALVISLVVSMFSTTLPNLKDQTKGQRNTVEIIHRMFPDPVAYIDRTTMIASYPKVGFFMSTWGMETYLATGRPVFRELLTIHAPKFLIASTPILDISKNLDDIRPLSPYVLRDDDFAVLKSNFVHQWGLVYVAGKTLRFGTQQRSVNFEVLIPGKYEIESNGPVMVNGVRHDPGSIIELGFGRHLASRETIGTVILRWSDIRYKPPHSGSREPIYTGLT